MLMLCLNNMNGFKRIGKQTCCLALLAGVSTSSFAKHEADFVTVGHEAPKNFQLPAGPQETHADFYFLGEFLQSNLISINPNNTITILDPQKLVTNMPGIVNKQAIIKALSGELAINTPDRCKPNDKKTCGVLNPDIAGVIFNPKTLRVSVFVNAEYLERAKQKAVSLLDRPNNSLSFVNEFNNTVVGPQDNNDFNLNSESILAYQDANIKMLSSYFRHLSNTGAPDKKDNGYQVQQIYGTLQRWGKDLQTGMIKSNGDTFLETEDILGLKISSNLNQIKNLSGIRGTPIPIFIATPSLVEVFKDGRLIYSGRYDAGNQFLDTSSFPAGSYDIEINITGVNNNVREISRFFSKTPSFPPLGHPQFYVESGYLGKLDNNMDDYPLFQEYSKTIISQAGGSIRLNPTWAAGENLMTSSILTASETNLTWLKHQQDLEFSLLLTNKRDYGTGLSYDTSWKKLNAGASINRIWGHHFAHERKANSSNIIPESFNLVSTNKYAIDSFLSFPLGKASINANADIVQQFNQPFDRNYSLSVKYPLYNSSRISVNSSTSLSYSDGDKLAFLNISIALKQNNWTNTITGNAQHESFEKTNSQGEKNNTTGYLKLGSLWNKNVAGDYHAKLGISGTNDSDYRQLAGNSYLNNQDFLFSLDVTRNLPRTSGSKDNTQYNGKFNTSLIVAENEFGFENTEKGETGLLVDVESPNSADKFEVLINNEPAQVVNANEPTFIYLSPYRQYNISVHSLAKTFYHYDQESKSVTLYQNSVKYLQWQAQPQYSFITTLINKQGKPIKNTELLINGKPTFTNHEGVLHVETPINTKTLVVKKGGGIYCNIKLPQKKPNQDYYYREKTLCGD
jgi:Mat/Ecp fimbriae outer membrane usher protein